MLSRLARHVAAVLVLAACAACGAPAISPAPPSPEPTPDAPPALAPWIPDIIDPAPGPVVVEAIANAVGVDPDAVTAAVLSFQHPARNLVYVWLFRVRDVAARVLVDRWVRADLARCEDPVTGRLGSLDAMRVGVPDGERCQPQYVVALDADTVAIMTDDGAYVDETNPSLVAYRPPEDIGALAAWLRSNLSTIALQGGGEFPANP